MGMGRINAGSKKKKNCRQRERQGFGDKRKQQHRENGKQLQIQEERRGTSQQDCYKNRNGLRGAQRWEDNGEIKHKLRQVHDPGRETR